MKKRIIFISLLISLLFLSNFISAQQNPGDVSDILGSQLNVDANKIPTSQEDIQEIRDRYLIQGWENFFSKNKYLAPVHNFLKKEKTQWFFKIVFAHEYEISLTFFLIFVLWFVFFVGATKIIESIIRGIKKYLALLSGALVAIILAQARLYLLLANFFNTLFVNAENGWIKTITAVLAFGLVIVLYVLLRIVGQRLEKTSKTKRERENQEKIKENEAFVAGVKKGQELAKRR